MAGGRHICKVADRAEQTGERQREPGLWLMCRYFTKVLASNLAKLALKHGKNNSSFISHNQMSLKYGR